MVNSGAKKLKKNLTNKIKYKLQLNNIKRPIDRMYKRISNKLNTSLLKISL